MTASKKLRLFPKILADELSAALCAVDDLSREQLHSLLAQFRRNQMRHIAHWGLHQPTGPTPGTTPLPLEYLFRIARLDLAFQALHRYRAGGASDYVAEDVLREVEPEIRRRQSQLGGLAPRKSQIDRESIARRLRAVEYDRLPYGHKKRVRVDLATEYRTSERVISDIARDNALKVSVRRSRRKRKKRVQSKK